MASQTPPEVLTQSEALEKITNHFPPSFVVTHEPNIDVLPQTDVNNTLAYEQMLNEYPEEYTPEGSLKRIPVDSGYDSAPTSEFIYGGDPGGGKEYLGMIIKFKYPSVNSRDTDWVDFFNVFDPVAGEGVVYGFISDEWHKYYNGTQTRDQTISNIENYLLTNYKEYYLPQASYFTNIPVSILPTNRGYGNTFPNSPRYNTGGTRDLRLTPSINPDFIKNSTGGVLVDSGYLNPRFIQTDSSGNLISFFPRNTYTNELEIRPVQFSGEQSLTQQFGQNSVDHIIRNATYGSGLQDINYINYSNYIYPIMKEEEDKKKKKEFNPMAKIRETMALGESVGVWLKDIDIMLADAQSNAAKIRAQIAEQRKLPENWTEEEKILAGISKWSGSNFSPQENLDNYNKYYKPQWGQITGPDIALSAWESAANKDITTLNNLKSQIAVAKSYDELASLTGQAKGAAADLKTVYSISPLSPEGMTKYGTIFRSPPVQQGGGEAANAAYRAGQLQMGGGGSKIPPAFSSAADAVSRGYTLVTDGDNTTWVPVNQQIANINAQLYVPTTTTIGGQQIPTTKINPDLSQSKIKELTTQVNALKEQRDVTYRQSNYETAKALYSNTQSPENLKRLTSSQLALDTSEKGVYIGRIPEITNMIVGRIGKGEEPVKATQESLQTYQRFKDLYGMNDVVKYGGMTEIAMSEKNKFNAAQNLIYSSQYPEEVIATKEKIDLTKKPTSLVYDINTSSPLNAAIKDNILNAVRVDNAQRFSPTPGTVTERFGFNEFGKTLDGVYGDGTAGTILNPKMGSSWKYEGDFEYGDGRIVSRYISNKNDIVDFGMAGVFTPQRVIVTGGGSPGSWDEYLRINNKPVATIEMGKEQMFNKLNREYTSYDENYNKLTQLNSKYFSGATTQDEVNKAFGKLNDNQKQEYFKVSEKVPQWYSDLQSRTREPEKMEPVKIMDGVYVTSIAKIEPTAVKIDHILSGLEPNSNQNRRIIEEGMSKDEKYNLVNPETGNKYKDDIRKSLDQIYSKDTFEETYRTSDSAAQRSMLDLKNLGERITPIAKGIPLAGDLTSSIGGLLESPYSFAESTYKIEQGKYEPKPEDTIFKKEGVSLENISKGYEQWSGSAVNAIRGYDINKDTGGISTTLESAARAPISGMAVGLLGIGSIALSSAGILASAKGVGDIYKGGAGLLGQMAVTPFKMAETRPTESVLELAGMFAGGKALKIGTGLRYDTFEYRLGEGAKLPEGVTIKSIPVRVIEEGLRGEPVTKTVNKPVPTYKTTGYVDEYGIAHESITGFGKPVDVEYIIKQPTLGYVSPLTGLKAELGMVPDWTGYKPIKGVTIYPRVSDISTWGEIGKSPLSAVGDSFSDIMQPLRNRYRAEKEYANLPQEAKSSYNNIITMNRVIESLKGQRDLLKYKEPDLKQVTSMEGANVKGVEKTLLDKKEPLVVYGSTINTFLQDFFSRKIAENPDVTPEMLKVMETFKPEKPPAAVGEIVRKPGDIEISTIQRPSELYTKEQIVKDMTNKLGKSFENDKIYIFGDTTGLFKEKYNLITEEFNKQKEVLISSGKKLTRSELDNLKLNVARDILGSGERPMMKENIILDKYGNIALKNYEHGAIGSIEKVNKIVQEGKLQSVPKFEEKASVHIGEIPFNIEITPKGSYISYGDKGHVKLDAKTSKPMTVEPQTARDILVTKKGFMFEDPMVQLQKKLDALSNPLKAQRHGKDLYDVGRYVDVISEGLNRKIQSTSDIQQMKVLMKQKNELVSSWDNILNDPYMKDKYLQAKLEYEGSSAVLEREKYVGEGTTVSPLKVYAAENIYHKNNIGVWDFGKGTPTEKVIGNLPITTKSFFLPTGSRAKMDIAVVRDYMEKNPDQPLNYINPTTGKMETITNPRLKVFENNLNEIVEKWNLKADGANDPFQVAATAKVITDISDKPTETAKEFLDTEKNIRQKYGVDTIFGGSYSGAIWEKKYVQKPNDFDINVVDVKLSKDEYVKGMTAVYGSDLVRKSPKTDGVIEIRAQPKFIKLEPQEQLKLKEEILKIEDVTDTKIINKAKELFGEKYGEKNIVPFFDGVRIENSDLFSSQWRKATKDDYDAVKISKIDNYRKDMSEWWKSKYGEDNVKVGTGIEVRKDSNEAFHHSQDIHVVKPFDELSYGIPVEKPIYLNDIPIQSFKEQYMRKVGDSMSKIWKDELSEKGLVTRPAGHRMKDVTDSYMMAKDILYQQGKLETLPSKMEQTKLIYEKSPTYKNIPVESLSGTSILTQMSEREGKFVDTTKDKEYNIDRYYSTPFYKKSVSDLFTMKLGEEKLYTPEKKVMVQKVLGVGIGNIPVKIQKSITEYKETPTEVKKPTSRLYNIPLSTIKPSYKQVYTVPSKTSYKTQTYKQKYEIPYKPITIKPYKQMYETKTKKYETGYAPKYTTGYAPKYTTGYAPKYTTGYAPSYLPKYEPPTYKVGYEPVYKPGYEPVYKPGYEPKYAPTYEPVYKPYYSVGYTPNIPLLPPPIIIKKKKEEEEWLKKYTQSVKRRSTEAPIREPFSFLSGKSNKYVEYLDLQHTQNKNIKSMAVKYNTRSKINLNINKNFINISPIKINKNISKKKYI